MTVQRAVLIATIFTLLIAGVVTGRSAEGRPPFASRLLLATTTSVADSGLLDDVLPEFTRTRHVRVDVIAVGTGQALAIARRGDADVVLVHAPALEKEFVAAGYGVRRTCLAYNTFVIVGPADDPARVSTAQDAVDAFARIAHRRAVFVSRGDGSGTEAKELEIWQRADLSPRGEAWYLVSGAGMAMTLTMAHEKQAYTLTDLATYLTMQTRMQLALLYEGDPVLVNQYAVIATSPARFRHVNFRTTADLIDYLVSGEVQETMGAFGRARFSRPLFVPLGGRCIR